MWASGKRRKSVERWAWKTENNKTRLRVRVRRQRRDFDVDVDSARQAGVLSEKRGGPSEKWKSGRPKFFGCLQFFHFSSFTFRFIYINTHSHSYQWVCLGRSVCLSACVSYFYLFSFYSTRLKTKHKSEQKINATYLLLFTTNTAEGTKGNVQATGPKNKEKEKLLSSAEKLLSTRKETWLKICKDIEINEIF